MFVCIIKMKFEKLDTYTTLFLCSWILCKLLVSGRYRGGSDGAWISPAVFVNPWSDLCDSKRQLDEQWRSDLLIRTRTYAHTYVLSLNVCIGTLQMCVTACKFSVI